MKKVYFLIIATMIAVICFACTGEKCYWNNKPDAVTGASAKYYFRDNMLRGKELMALLKNPVKSPTTLFVITTVRCDGTPNIAIIMPYAIDENTIMLVDGGTTTRHNLEATKYARALIRTTDPKHIRKKIDPIGNIGSRMLLKLIDDEKTIKKLYEENKGIATKYMARDYKDCMFLKIVEVYPLG